MAYGDVGMSNHRGIQSYAPEFENELRRKLRYVPETGEFFWKTVEPVGGGDKTYNKRFAGTRAGSVKTDKNREGYVEIHIKNRMVKAHRLAWWWNYGEWPNGEIDHINHNRSDNRIQNLRVVNRLSQNRNASMRKDNTSGFCGVSWDDRIQKWRACIYFEKRNRHLGYFSSLDDAVEVRLAAENKYGFSKTHGKSHNLYHEEPK